MSLPSGVTKIKTIDQARPHTEYVIWFDPEDSFLNIGVRVAGHLTPGFTDIYYQHAPEAHDPTPRRWVDGECASFAVSKYSPFCAVVEVFLMAAELTNYDVSNWAVVLDPLGVDWRNHV